jgi:hypothetical protein
VTNTKSDSLTQEEAEEKLLDAVDKLAEVQDGYELTQAQNEMLRESKAGISSVFTHLDGDVVVDL